MVDQTIRFHNAARLVREGKGLSVGDLHFRAGDETTLVVAGYLQQSLTDLTREKAIQELEDIKRVFSNIRKEYPQIMSMFGKTRVKFELLNDYGMGCIEICSQLDDKIKWVWSG